MNDQHFIMLQRPPFSSNSMTWERIPVDSYEIGVMDGEILKHAKDFVQFHNNPPQVVILDITFGLQDAPIIGIYWTYDQRLQWF